MQPTTIQWSQFTNNPIRARVAGSGLTKGGYASGVGHFCVKVSPGCKNCYSSELQPRFGLPQFQDQRKAGVESFLDAEKLEAVLRRRKPTKIFWCDMTDMFGEWVPNEWIAACFGVMAATPQHTHQVLTKRAKRMGEWFRWLDGARPAWMTGETPCDWRVHYLADVAHGLTKFDGECGPLPMEWPLPNVHLGVSAENQETADERIPHLLSAPAAVRWVSAEPLLSTIDFNRIDATKGGWRVVNGSPEPTAISAFGKWQETPMRARLQNGIDWVVVGGESGDGARPFELPWARSIRDQCSAAGAPVFVKQLGAFPMIADPPRVGLPRAEWPEMEWPEGTFFGNRSGLPEWNGRQALLKDGHGGDPAEWPKDLRVREFPPEPSRVSR